MRLGHRFLLIGGVLTAAASLLHVGIILGGPAWYRFFGAGEGMARQAERGFFFPTVVTAGIALALACAALYAFCGAGLFRRLPLTRITLILIATVFLARGILGIPAVLMGDSPYMQELGARMTFMWVTSAISLAMGVCYAIGAAD